MKVLFQVLLLLVTLQLIFLLGYKVGWDKCRKECPVCTSIAPKYVEPKILP